MRSLKDDVTRHTRENEKLVYENMGLKTKLDSNMAVPFLFMGNEEDFYQGEIKKLLSNYNGMTPKIRRGLEDIGFVFDTSDHQKVK